MPSARFHIMTFGCQMNANDSAWLARALRSLGYAQAEREEAEIHILNTCSVRGKPENKVYTELGRIRLLAAAAPEKKILACVGGCVAQQMGEKMFRRSKELRLIFGTDAVALAPQAIDFLVKHPGQRLSLLDFSPELTEREQRIELGRPAASAFVNIMQGCDNFCAYCIVPYVRGRQKSRKTPAILEECRALLGRGAREITLLGQNVNAFAQDSQGDGTSFAALLRRVAALPGLARLRFMTSHPKDMSQELILAFAELPNLAPHLHLPLQAGSDRILRAMGRGYTLEEYLRLTRALRAARPDLQLSTDIIVGFPGESEEDFQATLTAMQEADFCASFSFAYSDRPGTKAEGLPDKIPRPLALERLARLQAWQAANSARILAARVGSQAQVLVEGPSPRPATQGDSLSWQGKDACGFTVHINAPHSLDIAPGALLTVKINGHSNHALLGTLCRA